MMTRDEILETLARGFREHGYEGHGRHFWLPFPELVWMVQLELVPRTTEVGIYVGVSPEVLVSGERPDRANDCPIVFHPEFGGEPFGLDRREARLALDASSELLDEERLTEIADIARAVSEVAKGATTLAALRQMASVGGIRSFLRKDARALLFQG